MNISQIGGIGGTLQSLASSTAQFTDTLANGAGYGGRLNAADRFASETGAAGMTQAFGAVSPQAASSVTENAGKFFKELVSKVNEMQANSDRSIQQLATGENRNLHETMIAVEKASISFQFMSQVRNKALEAYQEIMRMPV